MILADFLPPGQLQVWIIVGYLAALILLGILSGRSFRGTAVDYFVASRGLGPVLLVLSIFGTTMTAFAIQGSSGEAWSSGIGVYGKMASWSGIVHAACFFLIGMKLWGFGKRYGYQTQIQFFRDRFESSGLGLLLFPILAVLQMPYIIIGIIGSGNMIKAATAGAFPSLFPVTNGAVPFFLGTLVCTGVVWLYVSIGGARATAWANALQTLIFLVVGVVTFLVIANKIGGVDKATQLVQEFNPSKLTRGVSEEHLRNYDTKMAAWKASTQPVVPQGTTERPSDEATKAGLTNPQSTIGNPQSAILKPHKPKEMTELEFLSYGMIPLSVAMFPHLFQLWLTARSAKAFRLTVTLHPLLIMLIWLPCILIGVWATSAMMDGMPVIPAEHDNPNAVLALMVRKLSDPLVSGLLAAGVLAAILGGMDAQFLSLGSMFTHDIVDHYLAREGMTDRQRLLTGRIFVVAVVLISWLLTLLWKESKPIFGLAVWCFSGFSALFPLICGALYWKRMTKWGAYASILAGIGTGVYFYIERGMGARGEPLIWGLVPAAPMVAAAAVALIVVSLVTRPPSQATIDKFFRKPGHAA